MEIRDEHKALLKGLGLREEDFDRFDDRFVRYDYDEEKGVRLYDPYYQTSYNEYIGIDGWSAWSTEKDTFMSDILKGAKEKARQREASSPKPEQVEIEEALRKKFGKGTMGAERSTIEK
ncbi:MAG: hypothetical protein V1689_12665 [Pseudomonadota bacterium]